jgi:hypothetical protein
LGLLSLLAAAVYYHPIATVTLIGVVVTLIGVIARRRPT